jgi:hypothetical protein
MNRRTTLALMSMAFLCSAVALPAGNAVAQEKQHVSFKAPAENSKYTQQNIIDVGDMPGHQVRVFEIHRTFPNDAPVVNGVKLAETWTRGASDFTDGNGNSTTYSVFVAENGDKFFTRAALVAQSIGPGKFTTTAAGTITGGTGKFAGIRGLLRTTGSAEPKVGVNDNQYDIEYWMDK